MARNKSLLHGVLAQKDKSKKTNDDVSVYYFVVLEWLESCASFLDISQYLYQAPEVVRNKSLLQGVTGQGQSANVNIVQGIRIEEVQMGTGRRAESGKKVKVNYVGKFKTTGRVFDASKGRPFSFRLGRSEVIKGWDIGVQGMLVGGKRILTIPPEKAYGKSGAPPTIPPNSTLVFEVTLFEVI